MTKPTTTHDQLIAAARGGDEDAFGQLVRRYQDVVFATVVAVTRDLDVAQDIAQEVFLRAWFGIGQLADPASFAAWLRTIARNRSRTWLERRQRQPLQEKIDEGVIVDGSSSPAGDLERAERRRMVEAALANLPEVSREALVLHYMEGMKTPQMATQLGISEPATRQRLRRARLQMQEEVEEMVADVIREDAPGEEFSDNVQALLERTRGLFQQVRYGDAVPALESAREQAPEDCLVSMLLAEAYTFTRGPEELEADRASYDRAMALLDEVVGREPDNILAQLRRASLRAALGTEEEVIAEHEAIVEVARGGPFEAVAQLELARRFLARGKGDRALRLYADLEPKHEWLACVLHSEQGVAHAMLGDGMAALGHFERAVALTTPEVMATLQEVSVQLMGDAYWAFFSTVDNLPVRQCQNHAWLAGLRAASGDMEAAREHVRAAVEFLNQDDVGPARTMLRREFVNRMEQMFPELAKEDEVQALRREIEAEDA